MFIVLRLLGRLPHSWRRFLGACLGDSARVLGVRRRVVRRNLQLAFPQLDATARHNIERRHFRLLGAVLLDEFALLNKPLPQLQKWISLADEEALRNCPPTIICAPHFVAMSIGGVRITAALRERMAFHYKPLHSKFWNAFYMTLRGQYGSVGISATAPEAMRSCVRFLREGGVLFYLPDLDSKQRKSTVFTPFLGVDTAATTTTLSRLASLSGAPVRMFVPLQTKEGYTMHLSPPLADFPSADSAEDARRINAIIAEYVQSDAAQYYWLHRRFKTRPPNEEKDRYA